MGNGQKKEVKKAILKKITAGTWLGGRKRHGSVKAGKLRGNPPDYTTNLSQSHATGRSVRERDPYAGRGRRERACEYRKS